MRKLFIVLAILAAVAGPIAAQSLVSDSGTKHWETDFMAGLNNDGYEVGLGIGYYPLQFVGVKMLAGVASEIEELGDWGKTESETGHHYTTRFKFTPSVVLRTPCLLNWKSQEASFYLFAQPGCVLSPGASGSRHAEWISWDLKCGINMQINRFIFTLGYGVSNFSLYSGYPDNHWGTPDADDYITHTAFIGGAYKF